MLENMDLLKDAAGGGCGMFDVGVRVRAGVRQPLSYAKIHTYPIRCFDKSRCPDEPTYRGGFPLKTWWSGEWMIGWSGFSGCVWRTKDCVQFISGVYGTEVVLAKTCCVLNNYGVPLKRTLK